MKLILNSYNKIAISLIRLKMFTRPLRHPYPTGRPDSHICRRKSLGMASSSIALNDDRYIGIMYHT